MIKVNFIGHSFGGVSARMLTELLINGSEEERAATDPSDLSLLFKGGNTGLVHSITTLASPHNGPRRNAKPNEKSYKPGIWNVMPVEKKDHMSYCGWMEKEETYANFYKDIYERVSNQKSL